VLEKALASKEDLLARVEGFRPPMYNSVDTTDR